MPKQYNEYKSLPNGLEIINNRLYYKKNLVNPIFYGAINIEWNIFLTFHYRQIQYQKIENSEKRRHFYEHLMRDIARNVSGLTNTSIVYLGVGECKRNIMHSHILLNVKDEHLHLTEKVKQEINCKIDRKVVEIFGRNSNIFELPKNIQEVVSPTGALSYILKPEWMKIGNTDKEIFHTDMHGDITSPKNKFVSRCNYFLKKSRMKPREDLLLNKKHMMMFE